MASPGPSIRQRRVGALTRCGRNSLAVELECAPPGVGWVRHARGARHSVSEERSSHGRQDHLRPNAGALSSHEDWKSCARCPTHGEQILHSTVARMPPRANTEAAKEQEIIAARSPLFATAPSGAFFMEIGVTTSTTCRQCGERFQVKPRAGRDTYRRRKPGDPTYPLARYCSSGCKQAAYRRRSAVTNTPVGTTAF